MHQGQHASQKEMNLPQNSANVPQQSHVHPMQPILPYGTSGQQSTVQYLAYSEFDRDFS